MLTPVFSHGQCLAHSVTTFRAILRRVRWIHLDDYTVDPTGTDLGQVKFVAFKAEPALRVGEGIEARGRFESRIARRFSILDAAKESVESFLNPAEDVLKNLAMNFAHIFTNL